ncbi:transporter [Geopsychrobacter electrodiphilus]|uniref:transporter n=1 Tax=Geopsychrobacter electrodiphilus TaxID=225196 RepID=UPI000A06B525|nr:transporter [Geopsychrobacter electrodiphilus]
MKTWKYLTLRSGLLLIIPSLLFCLSTSALGASNPQFSVSLGFDFASGNYGTSQTTDSYSIPLIIGYYPSERLDFSLEIPYLYQDAGSTVSLGGTRFPMQTSGSMTGGTSGSGMGGMGSGTTTSTSQTKSQTGLGDVTLTTGYTLFPESDTTPMLRPLVYLKFPTADKNKGLGTGAFDFGAGLSVGKVFGDWSLYAEALYVTPGSTTAYNPDNYWTYQGSVRYQLTRKLDAGLALSGATAAFAGNPDELEVQLQTRYRVSQQGSIGAYLGQGLSDSSPDYTAGFYGAISF